MSTLLSNLSLLSKVLRSMKVLLLLLLLLHLPIATPSTTTKSTNTNHYLASENDGVSAYKVH
jgi:hypothetical protein